MFALETERLTIRPWTTEDRAGFAVIMSDPEVAQYINAGVVFGEREIDEFFERQSRQLERYDLCMGAVLEKGSGRVVGLAGVQPLGTTNDLEIGWVFAREVWGRGYATEAGRAAMRHVLETLARPRVVAIIDPDNAASKRVAARLGMEYDRRYSGRELGHRKPQIVMDLFFRNRAPAGSGSSFSPQAGRRVPPLPTIRS